MSRRLYYIRYLFSRISYALLFFALARLIFFVFNAAVFAPMGFLPIISTFFFGLLFDLSAIAYLNSLFVLLSIIPFHFRGHHYYQLFLRILFVVTNGLGFLLNLIDVGYYKFSGKRTGSELFQLKEDIGALLGDYLLDYWYLALLFFALVWLMWKFYPAGHERQEPTYKLKGYLEQTLLMVGCLAIWVVAARGGFYLKPIRPFDAARFVKAELIPLTVNTPFQVLGTLENKQAPTPTYFSPQACERLSPYLKQNSSGKNFTPRNIVIIILESVGKEYVGYHNQGKGFTPFLDSLAQHSFVFSNAFACGKKSIEALPAILSSTPSLLDMPFINSPYQTNRLNSLGRVLQQKGFQSAFFHGARNGTMGFDAYVAASGFGNYYGLNEYPNNKRDFDGHWGIYDEPYLQYVSNQLSGMKQPFCAGVFTLSSHHPYSIPGIYANKFPKGYLEIHESVGYTDFALRQFFASAEKMPWYKNTVFVITADHSALNADPRYQTPAGKYEVPLFIFDPTVQQNKETQKTTSHADIMPTVLSYLEYPDTFGAFGSNAFDESTTGYAIQLENGIYQLISMPYVLHFDGQKSIALYNLEKDPRMQQNIRNTVDAATQTRLENQVKAMIQNYFTRLNNNSLLKN